MTSLKPILLLLLVPAFAGCSEVGSTGEEIPTRWEFWIPGREFPHAVLERTGEGTSIGPDLKLHEATFYVLRQPVVIEGRDLLVNYTFAVSDDFHVLAMHADCHSFDVVETSATCSDSAQVALPVGEETLFFQAPLIIDSIPEDGGPFSVHIWTAAGLAEARFMAEKVGEDVVVNRVGPRVTEHFVLDNPQASNGRVWDCDVFEGGVLIVRGDELGCRDKGEGEWWVKGPIPRVTRPWSENMFVAPLPVGDSPHNLVLGTSAFPFPVEEAVSVIESKDAQARSVMQDPEWKVGEAFYGFRGSSTIGAGTPLEISCTDFAWTLHLVSARDSAVSEAVRTICSNGLHTDDAKEVNNSDSSRWPDGTRSTDVGQASKLLESVLCLPDDNTSLLQTSRGLTGRNETWLVIGGTPEGSRTGGGSLNGFFVQSETGFILLINDTGGGSRLMTWMKTGVSGCESGAT